MAGISSKRNKLLHRFYEPLVLLYALDQFQGDQLYSDNNRPSLDDATEKELRRRYLNSLSYICDYKKGGDTVTAIGAAANPLRYYIASNKAPQRKVTDFLESVFSKLEQVYNMNGEERIQMESMLLKACVEFSEQRIRTYLRFLQLSMKECAKAVQDKPVLENFIRERVNTFTGHKKSESPFRAAKHYIGRIAAHVKNVKVLLAAAQRLPQLVLKPEIIPIKNPPSIVLPAPRGSSLKLDSIANRMVPSSQSQLLSELRSSLQTLDRLFSIENTFRRAYLEKNPRARVHAELIVLEYFYERSATLEHWDNDRFIGCSKPACYCCSLYFQEHPADVEPPSTHQRIYLNWLPPTNLPGVEDPSSRLATLEKKMLNAMVQRIRIRTIEQIRSQTGRRQKQYDSTTGETYSTHTKAASMEKQLERIDTLPVAEGENWIDAPSILVTRVADPENEYANNDAEAGLIVSLENVHLSRQITESCEDSDDEQGVKLLGFV
ncbi:uncharacterized protein A1O9_03118 [Exophiala aquamarina CBS 119918]|uniref:Uncharacterized protein n=1 Tax=Exophiala aquamarina CBS 119918 TaxID=1182545 RepID=A0A072PNT2_9EURO|nr:uncharacterized protein A1O9_03118 [Exophiala aquamarina CBS 119918]KEF61551.1 hypothetical protein A1O9_03118 [Exophiala aquamarina CBS 119918]